jgi:hypothetical protein
MKSLRLFILVFVMASGLSVFAGELQQKPSVPILEVPDLMTAKAAAVCIDCEAPFDMPTHKEVLDGLASNPYVAQLRKALYVQDIGHQFESKAHFDNCDFESSIGYIENLLKEVGEHVDEASVAKETGDQKAFKKAIEQAFFALGQALHGVQDFYAHTNYVELQAPRVKNVTDIDVIAFWRPSERGRVTALQDKGLVSGYVFWGFPKRCPAGTPSHSKLAKDSANTESGRRRISHLKNISQYRVAVFLARESSLALMRDAYRRWPLLKEVNGPYVAFETFVDRRGI